MTFSARHETMTGQIAEAVFTGEGDAASAFVAMIRQESGFDLDVIEGRRVSSAGAEGIAQIMRPYHPGVDPLDAGAALRYAAGWLRVMIATYTGRLGSRAAGLRAAVAAYNAGPGTLNELIAAGGAGWETAGLPGETRAYLAAVFGAAPAPAPAPLAPVTGPVTQGYGPANTAPELRAVYRKGYHTGIDFGAAAGTPVVAVRDGVVTAAGPDLGRGETWGIDGYGLRVVLDAGDVELWHGHLSEVLVAVGQAVRAGERLGLVGSTGMSTGPHLHFEARRGGTDVDPAPYLTPEADAPPAAAVLHYVVTPADGLRLRAGPGTEHAALATAGAGERVELRAGDWLPVRWGGRDGWMAGAHLAPVAPVPAPVAPADAPPLSGEWLLRLGLAQQAAAALTALLDGERGGAAVLPAARAAGAAISAAIDAAGAA